jgi:hypothetical protein
MTFFFFFFFLHRAVAVGGASFGHWSHAGCPGWDGRLVVVDLIHTQHQFRFEDGGPVSVCVLICDAALDF